MSKFPTSQKRSERGEVEEAKKIRSEVTQARDLPQAQLEAIITFVTRCITQHHATMARISGDEEDGGISIDWLSTTNGLSFGASIWIDEGSGHILRPGERCLA